jgi:tetratricopeptide (TPR) repeat protein
MGAATDFTSVLNDSTAPEVKSAAQYNLALCHRMLGEPDKAAEMLTAYRKQHPNDERSAEVAHQIGIIHEDAGRFKEASSEYNNALACKMPAATLCEVRYRLGICREKLGDDKGAIAIYALAAAIPKSRHVPAFRDRAQRGLYEKPGLPQCAGRVSRPHQARHRSEIVVAAKARTRS